MYSHASIYIFFHFCVSIDDPEQDTHVLLTKSMEALLAKSAKLRDIESKVENHGDSRPL